MRGRAPGTPLDADTARAASALREAGVPVPELAVVLGSGLAPFADGIEDALVIPYGQIPGFPCTAVKGHRGAVHAGRLGGARALVLSGRVHYYEGRGHAEVTFGVRLAGALGARFVVITNAAGAIDPTLGVGYLMLLAYQISAIAGPRRPAAPAPLPMVGAYSPRLRAIARDCASDLGIRLREGVYLGLLGPSYETPSEIRLARAMGASAVGMSTVAEVQAAFTRGLEVLGVSLIANLAVPVGHQVTTHRDVLAAGESGAMRLLSLVKAVVHRLHS
jgi:purine-nucleoside phosphorylase